MLKADRISRMSCQACHTYVHMCTTQAPYSYDTTIWIERWLLSLLRVPNIPTSDYCITLPSLHTITQIFTQNKIVTITRIWLFPWWNREHLRCYRKRNLVITKNDKGIILNKWTMDIIDVLLTQTISLFLSMTLTVLIGVCILSKA